MNYANQMKTVACARVAHEANRVYCIAIGDDSQLPWEQTPESIRASAIDGVSKALAGATPREQHDAWCAFKRADGWTHGATKDGYAVAVSDRDQIYSTLIDQTNQPRANTPHFDDAGYAIIGAFDAPIIASVY
jgi:hypothetical protein